MGCVDAVLGVRPRLCRVLCEVDRLNCSLFHSSFLSPIISSIGTVHILTPCILSRITKCPSLFSLTMRGHNETCQACDAETRTGRPQRRTFSYNWLGERPAPSALPNCSTAASIPYGGRLSASASSFTKRSRSSPTVNSVPHRGPNFPNRLAAELALVFPTHEDDRRVPRTRHPV
jgi:hypothetical protein